MRLDPASHPLGSLVLVSLLTAAPASGAQSFGHEWVSFTKAPGRLVAGEPVSDPNHEVDLAWADLNLDGWVDLVCVRKEPWATAGKRTNLLLMNDGGVLTGFTPLFASASDVPGDQGFLTPTNDRDVAIADIDLDGWPDVITAPTISVGDPKHIGHPRIYRNLGEDAGGSWLGLRHEDARIPQLVTHVTGLPVNPNFCSVAAGDVNGDGAPDLYFVDYDSSVTDSFTENPAFDLDDRLLINDGAGYFTDESTLRMTPQMLISDFGTHAEIADVNGDGANDVVKDNALLNYAIRAIYNDPEDVGQFQFYENFETTSNPYDFNLGDLNNDGRLDIVISSDFSDRYRYNLGNDPLGRVIWGPARLFQFLAGAENEFGANNLVTDLDGDGWNDVVICDVDVDVPGIGGRIHIYHNPGGAAGTEIELIEEREAPTPDGWIGAGGIHFADLIGGHDVATFDLDRDGDTDMILARNDETMVWENTADPDVCQTDLGFGGPGTASLSVCGPALKTGATADLTLTGAPPGAPSILGVAAAPSPVPFAGGLLVPFPPLSVVNVVADALGAVTLPVPGGNGPLSLVAQFVVIDGGAPEGFQLSNAVEVLLLP